MEKPNITGALQFLQQRLKRRNMDNANKPAYPVKNAIEYEYDHFDKHTGTESKRTAHKDAQGFTKREKTCIELGVPETGDPELDEIIRKAERKKIAMAAMQGILSNNKIIDGTEHEWISSESAKQADVLLQKLENTEE